MLEPDDLEQEANDKIAANPYLARQARVESNARSYPRRIPIALRSGKGIYLTDTEGRTYIDCLAGAGAFALGHSHPVVLEAVQQALKDSVPWQTLDLTTPIKHTFVEELFRSLPGEFAARAKIQFCAPSGADAVEAALKLIKIATGRRTIIAFQGGYHGMTHGALSITGDIAAKQTIAGLMSDVQVLPYPYDYRCPFGVGGAKAHQISIHLIESMLSDPAGGIAPPAGVILEAVQGEGGVVPAPDHWLREVRRITKERDIPLIVDEVQTGLGRTGALYAFEHAGIIPDVIVLSKAIGGGLPISVVVYDTKLDVWQPGAHAGTFRGNQLAMAAGAATIRYVRRHRLWEHAQAMGQQLQAGLCGLVSETQTIGDVRGRGLMVGVEVVNREHRGSAQFAPPASAEMAMRIQRQALRCGLVLEIGGRFNSVLRFLPPLIVSAADVDEIVTRFSAAVRVAEAQD
ncbi:MAG: diaminobutyrate--2-oxoglutarate transaminase [Gammaproteobacteria bacterium]